MSEPQPVWLRTLYERANDGDCQAQYMLGVLFATGEKGVVKSNHRAARWYRLASDRGFAPAQYNLGTMYLRGEGVRKNTQIGLLWLRKAAKNGSTDAQLLLGGVYSSGLFGVRRNRSLAEKWYLAAIKRGQPRAECELGLMYLQERGTRKNAKKGIDLIRRSERHGYVQAKEYLAKYRQSITKGVKSVK